MSAPVNRCWGVIPAAGIGARMSAPLPKQYLQLLGVTVLERSLSALLACPEIDSVVVALHRDDEIAGSLACFGDARVRRTVGGDTRSESVLAALGALAATASEQDWVLVHDAARPCVESMQIAQLVAAVVASGVGGILAEPIADTVKQSTDSGDVLRTLDRSTLWRAQTPQMFRLGLLRAALEEALRCGHSVTDEASAMEMAGHRVQILPGSSSNLKITLPEDLPLAAFYLQREARLS